MRLYLVSKTSASSVLSAVPSVLCAVFLLCHSCTYTWSLAPSLTHDDTSCMAPVRSQKTTHVCMVAGPLLQRTRSQRCHVDGTSFPRTAGAAATSVCRTPSDAPRIDCSPQCGRYEGTYLVGGAEESDARSVREEERPELENLVVLGKVLRRSSAFSA